MFTLMLYFRNSYFRFIILYMLIQKLISRLFKF